MNSENIFYFQMIALSAKDYCLPGSSNFLITRKLKKAIAVPAKGTTLRQPVTALVIRFLSRNLRKVCCF